MSEAVSVRLVELEFETYVPGPDSPYPVFMWAGWRFHYPYSSQLDLSHGHRPVKHRAVILENQYVRVTVLPDLGGKIFSLFDKTAGHDAFMVPPTIKFQNISLRGTWLAGGIELNFGSRHHTAHGANPVTWAMRKDDDGGASVWVGSVTRPIEARYATRIRLRPDRAAMDLEIHTMGPQTLPGMMYWWTNTAVEVTPHSHFYYYGLFADSGHGRHSWPIADGLDFRWYRNRHSGADMFLMQTQRDYMAFYDFGRRHGVANIANRFKAPGQKYFTWGTDPQGKYWDKMLSDAEQTYCEIQRGRLPSQALTDRIPALSDDAWSETWMPLNGLEGFSHLQNDLALCVANPGENAAQAAATAGTPKAAIRLLSAVPRSKALKLEAFAGGKSIGAWTIAAMQPGKVVLREAALPKGAKCDAVKVADGAGAPLLDWAEFVFKDQDWWSDAHKPFEPKTASVEQLFLEAERNRFLEWPHFSQEAWSLYDEVLSRDPGHSGALQAKAELAMYDGKLEEAQSKLQEALKRKPYDPTLLALHGWTLFRQGKAEQAVEAFANAARYLPGRREGMIGLVSSLLRLGRLGEALAAADEFLGEFPRDRWGRLHKAMALRKTGQAKQAKALIGELLAEDPLWSRLHAEALLLGIDPKIYDGRRRLGDDSLTAAGAYLELNWWDDAAAILAQEESNEAFSPAIRLAHLAFAQHKRGERAGVKAMLAQLRKAPVEQANAWPVVSIWVLGEMSRLYADEPMLHMLYGTILASRMRVEEAAAEWKKAEQLGLKHTVLYHDLAAAAHHAKNVRLAERYARKAWESSGFDVACYGEFDRFLAGKGRHKERLALYESLPERLKQRSSVGMRQVIMLLDNSRYDEAMAQLRSREFLIGEFERTIRRNYMESLLGKTAGLLGAGELKEAERTIRLGLEYPRNMNTGKSYSYPGEALVHYMLGLVLEAAGQADEAVRQFQEAAMEGHGEGDVDQSYEMLAWLALGRRQRALGIAHRNEKLHRGEEEMPWLIKWWGSPALVTLAHGLGQMLKGRPEEGRSIWRKKLKDSPGERWFQAHLDIPRNVLARMMRTVTGPMGKGKP